MLLQFKRSVFYLNLFHIYSSDGKAEFSAAVILIFSLT